MNRINVNKKEFQNIKKDKQTIIIRLNNDDVKNIKANTRVIVKSKIDSYIKKVKEVKVYKTLDELVTNADKRKLGYRKNANPNYNELVSDIKEDIEEYGLVSIEFKKKTHIFRNIMSVLLGIILLFTLYMFSKSIFNKLNVKKMQKGIEVVSKEKTSHIFIDINPSLVLETKDDKVIDLACLNNDCLTIYDSLDIKGKNLIDSIDFIYNKSSENGFDVTNGVRIRSTDRLNIDIKDYMKVEYITRDKEVELLDRVINNESIKNIDNQNYYTNLWNKLKKDSDYGKVYECEMNDNKLSCYFKKDFFVLNPNEMSIAEIMRIYATFNSTLTKVFDKFGISYEANEIVPNISELKLKINLDGHDLIFNIEPNGICDSNLISADGTYYTWGTYGHGEGGEIYNLTLYKSAYALDLLNPNDIVNHIMLTIEETFNYKDVDKHNAVDPESFPMILSDDSEIISHIERRLCNLNTKSCSNFDYLAKKVKVTKENGGITYNTPSIEEYEQIDKATYDKYFSYTMNFEGHGSHLENIGLGNGVIWELELNGNTYYIRCSGDDIKRGECTKITKSEFYNLYNQMQ